MASAQVYLSRDIRVGSRAPSQPKPGIHPPIADQNAVILQGTSPKSHRWDIASPGQAAGLPGDKAASGEGPGLAQDTAGVVVIGRPA